MIDVKVTNAGIFVSGDGECPFDVGDFMQFMRFKMLQEQRDKYGLDMDDQTIEDYVEATGGQTQLFFPDDVAPEQLATEILRAGERRNV
jgi:hypothetical protein